MQKFVEMENDRKKIVLLSKIHDELKRQNDLKELELEMRKFWIDRKVIEWKSHHEKM